MNRKIIPFSWYPAHWGLQGKSREIALAEFQLEGTELLRKKIDININERSVKEMRLGHLELDHRIGKLKDYTYAKAVIKVNLGGLTKDQVKIDLLELKAVHNKISDNELAKERANVLGEPWVIVKTLETDDKNPRYGRVELDWNAAFIEKLEEHGYGPNLDEEDTVTDWYNELCRNIALEAYAGIGDFEEQMLGEDAPINETITKSNLHEDAFVRVPTPTIVDNDKGTEETDDE